MIKLPVDGKCGYCGSDIHYCEAGEFCSNRQCGYVDGTYSKWSKWFVMPDENQVESGREPVRSGVRPRITVARSAAGFIEIRFQNIGAADVVMVDQQGRCLIEASGSEAIVVKFEDNIGSTIRVPAPAGDRKEECRSKEISERSET